MCLTPDMPWEIGHVDIADVEKYLEKADKLRRISLQNSQFFPETEVKRGMSGRDKNRLIYSK